jgi:hypothetical protein
MSLIETIHLHNVKETRWRDLGNVPLDVEKRERASLVENLRSLRGLDKVRVR